MPSGPARILHRGDRRTGVRRVAADQVTKEQRDFAKRLNFGVVYGIGAQRFSMMTGLGVTRS